MALIRGRSFRRRRTRLFARFSFRGRSSFSQSLFVLAIALRLSSRIARIDFGVRKG